jgi:acyl-coenzyme A thioesterase PaaI-like protein
MKKRLPLRTINRWPPFLGAGIRVRRFGTNAVDVEMRLRFWNRNYVGTHFGGSLYSMTDPFFMLMLIDNLGPEYVVWDKAATIRFKKPGRGTVRAEFRLSCEQIEEIRRVAANGRTEPTFVVQVKDEAGDVVAEVEKIVYIRRKDSPRGEPRPAK